MSLKTFFRLSSLVIDLLPYLMWAISYNKYEVYDYLHDKQPKLFQAMNIGILFKLFVHAAKKGNVYIFRILYDNGMSAKNCKAGGALCLYGVSLMLKHYPHYSYATEIIKDQIYRWSAS